MNMEVEQSMKEVLQFGLTGSSWWSHSWSSSLNCYFLLNRCDHELDICHCRQRSEHSYRLSHSDILTHQVVWQDQGGWMMVIQHDLLKQVLHFNLLWEKAELNQLSHSGQHWWWMNTEWIMQINTVFTGTPWLLIHYFGSSSQPHVQNIQNITNQIINHFYWVFWESIFPRCIWYIYICYIWYKQVMVIPIMVSVGNTG